MVADRTGLRKDVLIASTLVVAGVAIAALSLRAINAAPPQEMAQATQPPLATPTPEPQTTLPPAESKPGGGERPTTPAPEPARPDAEAQKAGAKPALPPAPAEKIAPPIEKK